MIIYDPTSGDVISRPTENQAKHCFLITQLGKNKPPIISNIYQKLVKVCAEFDYVIIDANTITTGRDFLLKIWHLIASVPMCIMIVHKDLPKQTVANLYYEVGIAQAFGKETLIIKTEEASIPSDLSRTEYVEFNDNFDENIRKFFKHTIKQAKYYQETATNLEKNPILSIDYLKRAYLITGDSSCQSQAKKIMEECQSLGEFENRAKNSIEFLVASFLNE